VLTTMRAEPAESIAGFPIPLGTGAIDAISHLQLFARPE
jgi:hypothetical protein